MFFFKTTILFIALIISNFDSYALTEKQDSVVKYYMYKNSAEKKIIESKFEEALLNYKYSIKYLPQFAVDSYNACLCALECNKFEDAVLFASKLVSKGVPISYFTKTSLFHKLMNQEDWRNFENQNPKPTFDKALHEKLDNLLIADQKFRKPFATGRDLDLMMATDSLSKIEMQHIFKTYGYPTEEMTGIWMQNDSLIRWGWSPLDIIIIHLVKREPNEYIDFFKTNVYNGSIRNAVFAMHSKNFSLDSNYIFFCLREGDGIIVKVLNDQYTCCCQEETLINKNRAKFYLNTLEEQRERISFKLKNETHFRIGQGIVEYFSNKGVDDLEKIKKELLNERNFVRYKK